MKHVINKEFSNESATKEIKNFVRKSEKISSDIEATEFQLDVLQSSILRNTSLKIKEEIYDD